MCAARYAFQYKFSNNEKRLEQQTHAERENSTTFFLSTNAMRCNAKPFVIVHTAHTRNISLFVLAFLKCMKNCTLNSLNKNGERKICVLTWPTKAFTSNEHKVK